MSWSARPIFERQSVSEPDPRAEFQQLYEALWNDDKRNQMICADVVSAVNQGRSPLVLTERIEHLQRLAQLLSPEIPRLILLQGGQSKKSIGRRPRAIGPDSRNRGAGGSGHGKIHR